MAPSFSASPYQPIEERTSYSITELADTFGVTVQAVHQWRTSGRLRRAFRASKKSPYRIPRREVVRLLRESGRPVPGIWEPPRRYRARVLLIDENYQIRRLVEDASKARPLPFGLRTAGTVEDGIIVAAQFMPRVILLAESFRRDRLQGVQALAFIRNTRAMRQVRVIAISASVKVGRKLLEGGADAFLQKPFRLDELKGAILSQLGRHARSTKPRASVRGKRA